MAYPKSHRRLSPSANGSNSVSRPISSPTRSFPQVASDPPQVRRTTCNLYRDRKVRCDRVKPECGRCKRTGQACTYSSNNRETAQINLLLQNLHWRLSRCCSLSGHIHSLIPSGVFQSYLSTLTERFWLRRSYSPSRVEVRRTESPKMPGSFSINFRLRTF